MKICITGVSGFIGAALARTLHAAGHDVTGTTSNVSRAQGLSVPLSALCTMRFESSPKKHFFDGCSAIVYCAHDFAAGAMERNVANTWRMRQAGEEAGVKNQIFVSSHSARADAPSEYGRTKYAIEQEFLAAGYSIIRPGLVIGPGGLFARTAQTLARLPIVPLPAGGLAPVPVIWLDDLLVVLTALLEKSIVGAFNLFLPQEPSQHEFVCTILEAEGRVPRTITLPTSFVVSMSRWLRSCGVGIPQCLARLETIHLNMSKSIHKSQLEYFLPSPLPLKEAITSTCKVLGLNSKSH